MLISYFQVDFHVRLYHRVIPQLVSGPSNRQHEQVIKPLATYTTLATF